MWNKEREYEGNEFIGREAGATVYRPDGSTDVSSGKAHITVNRRNNANYREDGATGQYGLHWNDAGHVVIARRIRAFLESI